MSYPQHLSISNGYRNTLSRYTPQHAATVVRDWHPLRRQLATGAMSVMLVSAMMVPNTAFAADWVQFDEGEQQTDAIETDTFNWGGAGEDDIAISGENPGFAVGGDANITVEDEAFVDGNISVVDGDLTLAVENDLTVNGSIYVDGDLAISGDDTVYGEDKPELTLTDSDVEYGYNTIYAAGDMAVSDINVTFDNDGYEDDRYYGSIYAGSYAGYDAENDEWLYKDGDITIVNSKIAAADVKDDSVYEKYADGEGGYAKNTVAVTALGELNVKGSVIDVNRVYSEGQMTIENSDVTATRNYELEDDEPFLGVYSATGIELIGEANGEIEEYTTPSGHKYYYVTTGSDDKVELKAIEQPAYYGPTQGMPATGDTENAGLMAGAAAAAAASMAAVGMSLGFRKRGQHEA